MKKQILSKFLTDASLEELEKSKAADIVVRIPKLIESYEKNIHMHRQKIIVLEKKKEEYNEELAELDKKRGLRFIFKASEIREKKAQLLESIKDCENSSKIIENNISLLENLVKEQQSRLVELKAEIIAAGLMLEDVIDEYHRAEKDLKTKKTVEPDNEQTKKTQMSTVDKKNTRISQVEKFARRIKKHQEIVSDKTNKEMGDN